MPLQWQPRPIGLVAKDDLGLRQNIPGLQGQEAQVNRALPIPRSDFSRLGQRRGDLGQAWIRAEQFLVHQVQDAFDRASSASGIFMARRSRPQNCERAENSSSASRSALR